jgi:hypothetical protein
MHVYSIAGERVGVVLAVEDNEVVFRRSWGRQMRVPLERVLSVGVQEIVLTQAKGRSKS